MRFHKSFKHAFNMVMHAKLRSWLTILGIVIGVAAVISIVSLGQTLQSEINSQLGGLGADLLTLRAGASRAGGFGGGGPGDLGGSSSSASSTSKPIQLDNKDVQVLKGVPDIKVFDTEISGKANVYYLAQKGSASVVGVDPAAWYQVTTVTLAQGRLLGPSDSNSIVIGGRIADGFFTTQLGVNQLVTVNDKLFRIVGILDDQSSTIYMPISNAYTILEDHNQSVYDTIIIKVKDSDTAALNASIILISDRLAISRHVQNKKLDFSLTSNAAMAAQRAEMMSSMTMFLTAIAAVALLVGSVGIANSMFTSVLEKTKEIGIMKAIGARNIDILTIFLLNAALIGFIGGLIGIIFGILLSGILPSLISGATSGGGGMMRMFSTGITVSVPTMIIAMVGSVLIGMVSGAIPAYQASKLKPVDALRYE